jgi:hypothetical protein
MTASTRIFQIITLATTLSTAPIFAADLKLSNTPDTIVLRDGTEVKGIIVRSVRGNVTIQTPTGEETYDRERVSRVHDVPGESGYILEIERKGDLPPWRTLVNDLRHSDGVTSLEQIPATVVDSGEFKNVPYLSFRVNGSIELNIFGDPEDPAGIELGIYGAKRGSSKLRRLCREFLVSYLNARTEIQAVYQLNENGGVRDAGDMTIEYTPPDAPDAYGAWWISAYNKKHLAEVRLDDTEYAKLTRPVDAVINDKGQVRESAWTDADTAQSMHMQRNADGEHLFVRGFYRDKNGDFRVITAQ